MDEKMKKSIKECTKRILEQEMQYSDLSAAYAAGYLHNYPELQELLNAIAGRTKK